MPKTLNAAATAASRKGPDWRRQTIIDTGLVSVPLGSTSVDVRFRMILGDAPIFGFDKADEAGFDFTTGVYILHADGALMTDRVMLRSPTIKLRTRDGGALLASSLLPYEEALNATLENYGLKRSCGLVEMKTTTLQWDGVGFMIAPFGHSRRLNATLEALSAHEAATMIRAGWRIARRSQPPADAAA